MNFISSVSEQAWMKLYRTEARIEQRGACAYCFEPLTAASTTADHRKPRIKGGAVSRKNIVAACEPCNKTKGHMSAAGFVRRIKNPRPGDGIHIWLAHFRRCLWRRTQRACDRITRSVTVPTTEATP